MIIVKELKWDEWNVKHIARHNVVKEEVEEVCHRSPIFEEGKKGRSLIIGSTNNGRILTIVVDPEIEVGTYYVVTARPASRKEQLIYKERKHNDKIS